MIFSAALCLPGEFLLWDNEQATDRLILGALDFGANPKRWTTFGVSRESRNFIASLSSIHGVGISLSIFFSPVTQFHSPHLPLSSSHVHCHEFLSKIGRRKMHHGDHGKIMTSTRPGKPTNFAMERSTMLSMGKSTISTGPFSIANRKSLPEGISSYIPLNPIKSH